MPQWQLDSVAMPNFQKPPCPISLSSSQVCAMVGMPRSTHVRRKCLTGCRTSTHAANLACCAATCPRHVLLCTPHLCPCPGCTLAFMWTQCSLPVPRRTHAHTHCCCPSSASRLPWPWPLASHRSRQSLAPSGLLGAIAGGTEDEPRAQVARVPAAATAVPARVPPWLRRRLLARAPTRRDCSRTRPQWRRLARARLLAPPCGRGGGLNSYCRSTSPSVGCTPTRILSVAPCSNTRPHAGCCRSFAWPRLLARTHRHVAQHQGAGLPERRHQARAPRPNWSTGPCDSWPRHRPPQRGTRPRQSPPRGSSPWT